MTLASLLMVLAQAVPSALPSAAPTATPLKEIGHVRTSLLCSTLAHDLLPAVAGLRLNDDLVGQGELMMQKSAKDAGANTGSAQETGGAGAGSEMDTYQLELLSSAVAKNLTVVEHFLSDTRGFKSDPAGDDERALALAKSRLEAVVAAQRGSLNVLSEMAEVNSANDLRAQRDIIPYEHDMSGPQTPPFTPISMPGALAQTDKLTQQAEDDVNPAMRPIVAACR
jgi:hypothetical protein